MSNVNPSRVRDIFMDAIDIPETERAAFLARVCGDDQSLLHEVQLLLRADIGSGEFLNSPTVGHADPQNMSSSYEHPGTLIGPYTLKSMLGEGGFGYVWLAERHEPWSQQVAIKIIKPGMDSRAVIERFEQERQALAIMDHPHVAKVFDGGIAPSGRPFFVMEYIHGEPITTFCDRHAYTVRQRLDLVISICEAVQHAHHKGIIHRDIKPSNILVCITDHRAIPKVIDFGIAKAVNHILIDSANVTVSGQFVGTPEYMSPEQAEPDLHDIDTRTDVYSLGVVLYELLAGVLPFEIQGQHGNGYGELLRTIREEPVPRPSTRLGRLDDTVGTQISANRQESFERLTEELRRELEWIPLKALRKDRERRYTSPEAMAADLRRYLDGRPLEAAPESRVYLVKKFVRRRRAQVLAACAVTIAVSGGIGMTLWQKTQAERSARDALEAAAHARRAEASARDREAESRRVAAFMSDTISRLSAAEMGHVLETLIAAGAKHSDSRNGIAASAPEDMLREFDAAGLVTDFVKQAILEPAEEHLETSFSELDSAKAVALDAIAERYMAFGLYDKARSLKQHAIDIFARTNGPDSRATLHTRIRMADILTMSNKLAEAVDAARATMDACRRVLGVDDIDTLRAQGRLGYALNLLYDNDESSELLKDALDRARRKATYFDDSILEELSDYYGLRLMSVSRFSEAEPLLREVLARRRARLGARSEELQISLNNLASVLYYQHRFSEAEPLFRESYEGRRSTLGTAHPSTIVTLSNLGATIMSEGEYLRAEPLLRDAVSTAEARLGPLHSDTLRPLAHLGRLYRLEGKFSESLQVGRDLLDRRVRSLGTDHEPIWDAKVRLAQAMLAQQDIEGAHQLLGDLFDTDTVKSLPELRDSPATQARLFQICGRICMLRGEFAEGEAAMLAAWTILEPRQFRYVEDRPEAIQWFSDLYAAWNDAEGGKGHDSKAEEWKAKLQMSNAK